MTKENYTIMSNQELLDVVHKYNVGHRKLATFLRKQNPELLQELTQRTCFLFPNKGMTQVQMSARLYAIEHNLNSHPTCANPNCPNHNRVKWLGRSIQKFAQYCCPKCRTSDENFWERIKQTNLKVRGVEFTWQAEEVKSKTKQTNLERRGVEWYVQTDEFKQKYKNSMLTNHGVEYPLQSKQIMQRFKETMKDNHGSEFTLQCKDLKERVRQTNMDKRGVDNPWKCKEVKEKIVKTMFEHHGVEHYAQSPEFHKKCHKRYTNPKYSNTTFGSSWEFLVYDFLLENHIDFEYQPAISLPYDYHGTHHTYHPDFLINGKIYEVKGDQFFRTDEITGKEQMFCPYRESDWTNEKYDWMCGLYEAKHQCMIDNNVTILRENTVKNMNRDMFDSKFDKVVDISI